MLQMNRLGAFRAQASDVIRNIIFHQTSHCFNS